MRKASPKTKFSTYFGLPSRQESLDFVDTPIGNDLRVFVDPSRLRSIDSEWSNECISLLQDYFEKLLSLIKSGDQEKGIAILSGLSERNELHLGLSGGISAGSGIGPTYAHDFWKALTKSQASRSGLLEDLEDACLFIDGVGPDRISDATCNIIRGPLIKYTQEMCSFHNIQLKEQIPSGPVWNARKEQWEEGHVKLPVTCFGPHILVPKMIVRHRIVYDANSYYRHYLLPEMQRAELQRRSSIVETLKDGRMRVTKKALAEKYGADKSTIANFTAAHPSAIQTYRSHSRKQSSPISHLQLAEIENVANPDFKTLLSNVLEVPPGNESAKAYELAIERLLSAIFYPSLTSPKREQDIHEGRKRVDIKYTNTASTGFFHWLATHYTAPYVWVECKNYGKEIGNPELDQLSGRFGPSRGQFGILICRSVADEKKLLKSCKDTANDMRGFIVVLTDEDLKKLVDEFIKQDGELHFSVLTEKFNRLTM